MHKVCVGDVIGDHKIEDIFLRKRLDRRTGREYNETRYVIKCPDCGHLRDSKLTTLRQGKVGPCVKGACYYKQLSKNFIGKRFGKLTIKNLVEVKEGSEGIRWMWDCVCDCGKSRTIRREYILHHKVFGVVLACSSCAHTQANDHRRTDGWGRVYGMYKTGAKKRKLIFSLTREDVQKLCSAPCVYCGALPGEGFSKSCKQLRWDKPRSNERNGVDRKDSKVGYVLSNCVSCCSRCNWAKSDMSVDGFLSFIEAVYTYRIKGGDKLTAKDLCAVDPPEDRALWGLTEGPA